MNVNLLLGVGYLILTATVPWAVVLLVARVIGDPRWTLPLAAFAGPVVAFAFGGAWFVMMGELTAEPNTTGPSYNVIGVFLIAGVPSVAYYVVASVVMLLISLGWKYVAPNSFQRFAEALYLSARK